MKKQPFFLICLSGYIAYAMPLTATPNVHSESAIFDHSLQEKEAQAAFQYFLYEVEQDAFLTHEEQDKKIQEFTNFANTLSPEIASHLTILLLQETRVRIVDILQNAHLEKREIEAYLADYEKAILKVQNMTVEIARQMLFFVAELKIHRHYVHDFGIALGCSEKQLLRHDLCKLSLNQFEGYARYFRGGRQNCDKIAFLAAWACHQHEEHHLESYSKEGFDFDSFSKERLKNNMLETVADWLAASKQRGKGTIIDYLVNVFPKKNYDLRLFPYLEEALIKAHDLHLKSKKDLDSYSLFRDCPCWNSAVEKIFREAKENSIRPLA